MGTPGNLVLTSLSDEPVAGLRLGRLDLLRMDLSGGAAPGNKQFKLHLWLQRAERLGVSRLVSFGGPWSNHLHALAATGAEAGLETVGLVRGDHSDAPSAMLQDAERWGMNLHFLSRSEYRRRGDPDYLKKVKSRFAPCLVIPEGGAGPEGVLGCSGIADRMPDGNWAAAAVACGTGTTLAGLVSAGYPGWQLLLGVSVLKGHDGLQREVADRLPQAAMTPWRVDLRFHCGGYARVSPGLREFILAFEAIQGIPLDPVYTGKLLYGLGQMIAAGEIPDGRILALHTGGLQGRRGYDWLPDHRSARDVVGQSCGTTKKR